ncbi:PKD domain-containing protein [Patescibacteria group bacterium]|nr:PKD domain-containing protein [Patescibacteria group bacterium]
MSKKIFIFLIIILLIAFGFLIFNFRKAKEIGAFADGQNAWGWAWSEKIGWISFNNTTGGGAIDYGVNIDPATGNLTEYAWSRGTTADVGGIGWISFNPAGPYPEAPDYSACLDLPGAGQVCDGVGDWTVSGWARAYRPIEPGGQTLGGWEGWIKMRGTAQDTTPYGVWLEATGVPDEYEFRGWAWGGDPDVDPEAITGWISFNCNNPETGDVCGTSNYKVMASLAFAPPNQLPYVESVLLDGENYCNINPGVGRVGFKWTYQDDDGDNQSQYHLQVFDPFQVLVVDSINPQSVSPGGTGTSAVSVVDNPTGDTSDLDIDYDVIPGTPTTYSWRVRAQAATGNLNWSDWEPGPDFTTPKHAWPWIDFDWSPQFASVDEVVQFADQSTVYGGAIKAAWNWVFPGDWGFEVGSDPSSQNPSGRFTTSGEKTVSLTVTDSDGFACTDSKSINVSLPLPEWKEIPPY